MAYELVTEVLDHAPATITTGELVVMVAIAEWVQHDDYRRGIRQCSRAQADLSRRTRLAPAGVKTALQRLAERGLELRVPLSIGKDGRPVYAVPGRVSTYRIPPLPAPPGCSCSNCRAKQGGTTGSPYREDIGDIGIRRRDRRTTQTNRQDRDRRVGRAHHAAPTRQPSRRP